MRGIKKTVIGFVLSAVMILSVMPVNAASDTYTVNKGGCSVKNGTSLSPQDEMVYSSAEEAVYTVRSAWEDGFNNHIVGFMVDGKFEEGVLNEDGSRTYTFPKGTTGEHIIYGVTKSEINHEDYGDVDENDWFYDSVIFVNERGLMTGLNPHTFGSVDPVARAQFAVVLYRIAGEPELELPPKIAFYDVDPSQGWYYDAVLWGFAEDIISGYSGTGYWGTADSITREQMVTVMYRYVKYKEYNLEEGTDIGRFDDAGDVSAFAVDAMKWAVGNGIITGKDNGTKLDPQGYATRAECSAIIQRFVEKYEL